MTKRTFLSFGAMLLFLAVLIPFWAYQDRGEADRGSREVPAKYEKGKTLFVTNCGTCHTLYSAGTDGDFGPNLDNLLAPNGAPSGSTAQQTIDSTKLVVTNAINSGVDDATTSGRMPAGIVVGQQAEEVANFVAATAGQG